MTTATRRPVPAWLRLKTAARAAGRNLYWVAQRRNMSYEALYGKVNGLPTYAPLKAEEMEAIERDLEVKQGEIFGRSKEGD